MSATSELPSSSVSTGASSAVSSPARRGWRSAKVPSVSRSPTCSPIAHRRRRMSPADDRGRAGARTRRRVRCGTSSTGSVGSRGSPRTTTTAFSCGVQAPFRLHAVLSIIIYRWRSPRHGGARDAAPPAGRHREVGRLPRPYRTRHAASYTVSGHCMAWGSSGAKCFRPVGSGTAGARQRLRCSPAVAAAPHRPTTGRPDAESDAGGVDRVGVCGARARGRAAHRRSRVRPGRAGGDPAGVPDLPRRGPGGDRPGAGGAGGGRARPRSRRAT